MYVLVKAHELCVYIHKKVVIIFTDSKYAYGIVHVFGKLWEERGLLTCRGNTLAHEGLVICLLEVVNLPKKIKVAIIRIRGCQAEYSEVAIGIQPADGEAWKVALLPEVSKILLLLPVTQPLPEKTSFPPEELEIIKNNGAEERGDD